MNLTQNHILVIVLVFIIFLLSQKKESPEESFEGFQELADYKERRDHLLKCKDYKCANKALDRCDNWCLNDLQHELNSPSAPARCNLTCHLFADELKESLRYSQLQFGRVPTAKDYDMIYLV